MPVPSDLENIDTYLPYLERMRAEGCYVLLKIDGPRPGKNQYTAVVSGEPIGDETFHYTDAPCPRAMAGGYTFTSFTIRTILLLGLRDE